MHAATVSCLAMRWPSPGQCSPCSPHASTSRSAPCAPWQERYTSVPLSAYSLCMRAPTRCRSAAANDSFDSVMFSGDMRSYWLNRITARVPGCHAHRFACRIRAHAKDRHSDNCGRVRVSYSVCGPSSTLKVADLLALRYFPPAYCSYLVFYRSEAGVIRCNMVIWIARSWDIAVPGIAAGPLRAEC